MKIISEREKRRRKYLNIYNSVQNKMSGNNLIWWNSLTMRARYHFVFKWILVGRFFPERKFKHFLKEYKPKYRIRLENRRNSIIDHLIK